MFSDDTKPIVTTGDDGTTSTSTTAAADTTPCALRATFPTGPADWDMTVQTGTATGDGPTHRWHITGPTEGVFIEIIRGSTPFPPATSPTTEETGDKVVAVYPIHEGVAASMHLRSEDPTSRCGELHLLGFGISEADLRTVVAGTVLTPDAAAGGLTKTSTAADVAFVIGCEDRTNREPDPDEPARPVEALNCRLGESAVGIQIYRSAEDRDAVLAYLHQFTGFRVYGETWLIAVDTPEAANQIAGLTRGKVIELSGTPTS